MTRRALCLTGVGLLLTGAGFAIWAVLFTGVGLKPVVHISPYDQVNLDSESTIAGYLIAGWAICAAATATTLYLVRRSDGLQGYARIQLGALLAVAVFGLPSLGFKVLPAWSTVSTEPFRDVRIPLLSWAAGIIVLGGLVVAATVSWSANPTPRLRTGTIALVAGLILGVAAAGIANAVVRRDSERVAATTTNPVAAAPVPSSPTAEKWRWRSGDDILSATKAGAGVVALTKFGLTAIDGVTGMERWHYRRTDTPIGGELSSPQGTVGLCSPASEGPPRYTCMRSTRSPDSCCGGKATWGQHA